MEPIVVFVVIYIASMAIRAMVRRGGAPRQGKRAPSFDRIRGQAPSQEAEVTASYDRIRGQQTSAQDAQAPPSQMLMQTQQEQMRQSAQQMQAQQMQPWMRQRDGQPAQGWPPQGRRQTQAPSLQAPSQQASPHQARSQAPQQWMARPAAKPGKGQPLSMDEEAPERAFTGQPPRQRRRPGPGRGRQEARAQERYGPGQPDAPMQPAVQEQVAERMQSTMQSSLAAYADSLAQDQVVADRATGQTGMVAREAAEQGDVRIVGLAQRNLLSPIRAGDKGDLMRGMVWNQILGQPKSRQLMRARAGAGTGVRVSADTGARSGAR